MRNTCLRRPEVVPDAPLARTQGVKIWAAALATAVPASSKTPISPATNRPESPSITPRTEGSNPVPSSGESVSVVNTGAVGENPSSCPSINGGFSAQWEGVSTVELDEVIGFARRFGSDHAFEWQSRTAESFDEQRNR